MRRKLIIAAVWLALWQLLAMAVNNMILLAGPADTLQALFRMAREPEYWCSIGNTMLRILGGFAAGSVLGILSAALSYRFRLIREFPASLRDPQYDFTFEGGKPSGGPGKSGQNT